nr:LPS export ABC transporter periplasmic protein LptC [Candidatus Omnitrophota bacterium]
DTTGLEQNVTAFSIEGRSPKGAQQWTLNGDSAQIVGEDIYLQNIKAVAFSDQSVINLSSDSGIYKKEAGEVELIGNVRVFSGSDFALLTESASWSQLNKEIYTEKEVNISREGMRATGLGGRANSDQKWARLNKEVKVFIEPDTRVASDGPLEVRYEDNLAVFRENVVVDDSDGRLIADMLTVEFDPETKRLAQVTAEGNVKVKKGNTYTLSDKAVYTEGTKSAQLLGRPRIIIDPAEIDKFDKMMM